MTKYIYDEEYEYEKYEFYYKVNDNYYFERWLRPTKEILLNLLNYYNHNFNQKHLFKLYVTGKFNSNNADTWSIDLIITYDDISNKNYNDIYDCLYFLNHHSLNDFNLSLNVKYVDTINNINEIININTINENENIIKQNLYELLKNQGEILTFYETIVKDNSSDILNDKFNQTINLNYHTVINDENNKKLFLFIITEEDLNKFRSIYQEKVNNITQGTIYEDNALLNNCGVIEDKYFN